MKILYMSDFIKFMNNVEKKLNLELNFVEKISIIKPTGS